MDSHGTTGRGDAGAGADSGQWVGAWRRAWRGDPPLRRTVGLAAVVAVVSGALFVTYLQHAVGPTSGLRLTWWMLAVGFAVAEVCVFHVEIRREALTFSLSEVPLALGLFFASPLALVVGRLVGEAFMITIYKRQSFRKVALNLATFLAECVVALAVLRLLAVHPSMDHPAGWLAALAAITAADLTSVSLVGVAIRWHGGPIAPAEMLLTNAITVVTNTSLALSSGSLLHSNPWSALPFCVMVAVIVVAYRGYTSLRQRFSSLQLLYDFTALVSGTKRPEAVLQAVLSKARELLRADSAAIHFFAEPGSPASAMWINGEQVTGVERADTPLPDQVVRDVTERGQVLVVPRDTKDPQLRRIASALGMADCVIAPLVDSNGAAGLLLVGDRLGSVSTFDGQDGRLFATLANHASVALEKGRLIDRLHQQAGQREHEALHDALTGLPNRTLLQNRLEQAIDRGTRGGGGIGVALMDLDHFKDVNDTLGHHSGDALLQEVARRLNQTLDPAITAARFGGDEFALLVPNVASRDELVAFGHTIQRAIEEPFNIEGLRLEVSASIGFALFPEHGRDGKTLLQRADVAMYTAKNSSTHHVEIYQADRDIHTPRRLTLASDLRQAIDTNQLLMYYQPKARLDNGAIVGAEALVRWNHPELGIVPPDEFVPLAERAGLIQPFTDFVLNSTIEQLADWSSSGLDVDVSVNLSMRNLLDIDLPRRIQRLLTRHNVDPTRITFEITESNIMSEPAKIIRILNDLSSLGSRLSVDDFGTGYSSLSYLQRLPVQEVKIDKSFVLPLTTDPGAAAIVRSIIDLSRNLGLTVVAEGVEDQQSWDQLRLLGCDHAQGYFLSRPMPPHQFRDWLHERQNATTPQTVNRGKIKMPPGKQLVLES